ncbi:MAG: hypothetical protein K9H64_10175 [Bacteroidales bacterium]|nr:hypothetical protein [Bacteroidales bacterium]MCF8456234.1 hypothetical protein [Bacteroidales bacterium]
MKNLIIENKRNQMVLKFNKKGFDNDYLISLVKRIEIEELAQKSGFTTDILNIAEQINQEWWDNNANGFLSGVNK